MSAVILGFLYLDITALMLDTLLITMSAICVGIIRTLRRLLAYSNIWRNPISTVSLATGLHLQLLDCASITPVNITYALLVVTTFQTRMS